MASPFSDRVVLLRLAGMVRVNWDIHVLALVFGLLPLAAVVIVLVWDRVLQAGALLPTAGPNVSCTWFLASSSSN